MIGAIIGDIAGSIYEFDNHRSKDFEFFGSGCKFTDDSVLTFAVADALLHGKDPASALLDWGRRYPGRGYGGNFAKWLRDGNLQPYGSFGNGAAMRVSPAAMVAKDLAGALALAHKVTAPTHGHPEGLKGAAATVHAIVLAREGMDAGAIRAAIASTYGYDMSRSVDTIRPAYEFNETCQRTVPEALICALEATGFEDAIRNAISIGGDSDTVAAIAGPVAEARFGIPEPLKDAALRLLTAEMREVLDELYRQPHTDSGRH